jgi:hypothetical protein
VYHCSPCNSRSAFSDSNLLKPGVTCGREARVYCFQCGDFVYHEIFDHERDRVDLATKLPWQAWKPHPVQRSFDALQFMRIQDQGIFWRGMIAAFPPLVPIEHVRAAQFCRLRQVLFSGEWDLLPLMTSSTAKSFARAQWEKRTSFLLTFPLMQRSVAHIVHSLCIQLFSNEGGYWLLLVCTTLETLAIKVLCCNAS